MLPIAGHQCEGNEHFQNLPLASWGQVLFINLEVDSFFVPASYQVIHYLQEKHNLESRKKKHILPLPLIFQELY